MNSLGFPFNLIDINNESIYTFDIIDDELDMQVYEYMICCTSKLSLNWIEMDEYLQFAYKILES